MLWIVEWKLYTDVTELPISLIFKGKGVLSVDIYRSFGATYQPYLKG